MMLDGGKWQGRQVVPERWVNEALTPEGERVAGLRVPLLAPRLHDEVREVLRLGSRIAKEARRARPPARRAVRGGLPVTTLVAGRPATRAPDHGDEVQVTSWCRLRTRARTCSPRRAGSCCPRCRWPCPRGWS